MTLSKAVCIVMKVGPTELKLKENNYKSQWCYWTSFLGPKLLGDFRIQQKLAQIDPSEINEEIIEKLELLLSD